MVMDDGTELGQDFYPCKKVNKKFNFSLLILFWLKGFRSNSHYVSISNRAINAL